MTYPEYICLCPEGATGYRCQVQCGGEIRNVPSNCGFYAIIKKKLNDRKIEFSIINIQISPIKHLAPGLKYHPPSATCF